MKAFFTPRANAELQPAIALEDPDALEALHPRLALVLAARCGANAVTTDISVYECHDEIYECHDVISVPATWAHAH